MSLKVPERDPVPSHPPPLVTPALTSTTGLRIPRVTERGAGITIIAIMAAAALIVPVLDSVAPDAVGVPMLAPSAAHLFGTDSLGRDTFVRVFMATRLDLAVTLISVTLAFVLGVAIGLVVGMLPKPLRDLAQRVIEAAIAIPYLVLAIGIWTAFGARQVIPGAPPGAAGVVIALVIVGWMPFANFTIAQVLSLRGRESIIAARVLGYGYPRVLLRHVAPFVLSANISYAATLAVLNITALAGLAILGVGIEPPTPELGLMVQQGIGLLSTSPWISLIPGGAILLLGLGFGLIADSYNQGQIRR